MEQYIEYTEYLVAMIFVAQTGFGFAVLILGRVMVEYYEWGIFNPPETWFQKSTNFFMKGTIGVGPYLYHRLYHYRWFVGKVLYTLIYLVLGLSSIILFQFFSYLIRTIFL
ncbi:hypothetical protein [Alkalihalophilus marmarensis]|uniref:hypothetical protein n=1 Tax=Alkalihalophilus marmarensis TaxID=521377 RepID=UPI002DBBBD56|nr:hypothetical protein [Alkalihalophilus marmarensis]MEC2072300.1 hypothetical protein [Alkalihalophilus marmarensis]